MLEWILKNEFINYLRVLCSIVFYASTVVISMCIAFKECVCVLNDELRISKTKEIPYTIHWCIHTSQPCIFLFYLSIAACIRPTAWKNRCTHAKWSLKRRKIKSSSMHWTHHSMMGFYVCVSLFSICLFRFFLYCEMSVTTLPHASFSYQTIFSPIHLMQMQRDCNENTWTTDYIKKN